MLYPLGKRLSGFRSKQEMTQQELADLMNVDVSTVSRWETGRIVPVPAHMRKLRQMGFRPPLTWGPLLSFLVDHNHLMAALYTGHGERLLAASAPLRRTFNVEPGEPWRMPGPEEQAHFDTFHGTLVEHGLHEGKVFGMRARLKKEHDGLPYEAHATWQTVLLPSREMAVMNVIRITPGETDAPTCTKASIEELVHG